MKNILLPTDYSKNSLNAIDYALAFFKDTRTDFFILNVQKTSDYTTSDMMSTSASTNVYTAVLDDNKVKLKQMIGDLEKKYPSENFTFHSLIDYDVFTDAINQAIQKNKIDLIIMGTNGATGAKEVIFGSNALKVIRQVDCPLVTIPEGYKYRGIKSLLLSIINPNDFTYNGLKPFKTIMTRFNSDLKVLDIVEDTTLAQKDTIEIMDAIFSDINYEYHSIKEIPAAYAIHAFEQLFPVDLHGIITRKETFFERALFGSETSKISYGSKVPLLIMR